MHGPTIVSAALSAAHLLGLGVGLGSVVVRARALGAVGKDPDAVARAMRADNAWGIAAILWLGSGLYRLFTEADKSLVFYTQNGFFWVKMGVVAVLMTLELFPMVTFIIWRVNEKRGKPIDTRRAPLFAVISWVEAACLLIIVFCAALMARGAWLLTAGA